MITKRQRPTFYFLGVTTGRSAGQQVFPRWADHLGLAGAELVGVDLPLQADPAAYRQFVRQIREDPLSLGALITSHKIDLMRAAADLFDEFTPAALLCNEISCIYKRAGRLYADVVEIDSFRVALAHWLGSGYFARRRTELVCLGAGGAATALLAYLGTVAAPADRPVAVTLVDRDPARLAHKEGLLARLPALNFVVKLVQVGAGETSDGLVTGLSAGSLIVNATGMGKDIPGSPLSDSATWPLEAAVWELNYRGDLRFLQQAGQQMSSRRLRLQDGWTLFCAGWAASVGQVFARPLLGERFDELCELARSARP